MQRSLEWRTTPSSVFMKQSTGQIAAQGASVQCMHAIETDFSPGLPSLIVTTRRRLMPHGTSCSFLHAVTQALHSMQRSESQRNFMRAMDYLPQALIASIWHSVHFVSCMCVTASKP